jgi:hypothetical protein
MSEFGTCQCAKLDAMALEYINIGTGLLVYFVFYNGTNVE